MARKTSSVQPTPSIIPAGEHVVVDAGFNPIHTGTHGECAAIMKVARDSKLRMMTASAYQAEYARLARPDNPPPALVNPVIKIEPVVAKPKFTPAELADALQVLKDAGYETWSDAYKRIVGNMNRGLTENEVNFVLSHAVKVRTKAVSPRLTGMWDAVRGKQVIKTGTWSEISELCKTDPKIAMTAHNG